VYKIFTISILSVAYLCYSFWIYNGATHYGITMTPKQILGKKIYQENNCQSCHQVFGLGGYLGPELTKVISDKKRGEAYAKVFLENGGGTRMPNFEFSPIEVAAVLEYLKYVDSSANSIKNEND
jgi:nitric oxide reductase subunit C